MFRVVFLLIVAGAAIDASPKVRPIVPMLDGRIVGGRQTSIENHPHQVSLQYYERHICGASMLSPRRALTAAHCTDNFSPSALSVRAGSSYHAQGGQVTDVAEIKQHPQYNRRNIDYDVSVLVLASALTLGDAVKPIALHGIGESLEEGEIAIVTGWGTLAAGGSIPSVLQEVEVPRVTDAKCKAAYGSSAITERMVCHGHTGGGKDACQGDSGGPLVSGGKQVGIVSWGIGCAEARYPGVYTRVANQDINNHITQNS